MYPTTRIYLKIKNTLIYSQNKITIAFLLFLIVCGFFLRIFRLGAPSFWIDEAISANAAVALLKHGTPTFLSGFVYMRAILNTVFISFSFMIFNVSEFSARFPSVIFGTLMIPLAYITGARLGNRKIGLLAAFFITFSVMEIAWSRQARMYQQLQFFYMASLYFFYEFNFNDGSGGNKNLRKIYLGLTILFFIGAILSHEFGYLLIPVFLSCYFISHFKEIRIKLNDFAFIRYINGFFILIVVLILFIIYFIQSDLSDLISNFLKRGGIGQVEYFDVYFNILETEFSFLIFPAVLGAVLSLHKNRMSGSLLILGSVIPFYILSYYVLLPATRYLYFIIPILLLFCSYFFDFLIELTQKNGQNSSTRTVSTIIAIAIISTSIIVAFSQHVFMIQPEEIFDLGVNAPHADFKRAYSYVRENMQKNDVLIDTRPAVSLFYMGRSDYWLAFEANGVGLGIDNLLVNNGSNDVYANARVIKNVDMLREVVVKNNRGWIVLDNSAWILISPDIKEYMINGLQNEAYDGMIRIYSWGMKK